ncbi:hypothetical protein ISCGN_018686 [Ixodes scapularis]
MFALRFVKLLNTRQVALGWGLLSIQLDENELDVSTCVPEGTPTALNYSKGTGDEFVIFWGPVPCELANGVVRRYYLELDSAGPWESRLLNHTTGDMRLVFSDLLPYTCYRAKVFAENDAGRSQVAAELNFTTSPAGETFPTELLTARIKVNGNSMARLAGDYSKKTMSAGIGNFPAGAGQFRQRVPDIGRRRFLTGVPGRDPPYSSRYWPT